MAIKVVVCCKCYELVIAEKHCLVKYIHANFGTNQLYECIVLNF